MRAGIYLGGRQITGILLGLVGTILVTRLIGPTNYGIYVGAVAVVTFLGIVGRLGIDVYLIRLPNEPEADLYTHATTLLLIVSTLIALGATATALALVGPVTANNHRLIVLFGALVATLPLTAYSIPRIASLERRLAYGNVAVIELAGQVSLNVVAVGAALAGLGLWAPVVGYWAWQVTVAAFARHRSRLPTRYGLSWPVARDLLRYGVRYSTSVWVSRARILVNPLVVGRLVGADAVAFIALAFRLIDALTVFRNIAWRLSIAAFARIATDRDNLSAATGEAATLQVFATAPFVGGFACAAAWVVPFLFGASWSPSVTIFPFLAFAAVVATMFTAHTSALYVLGSELRVTVFWIANVTLLLAATVALVPHYGLVGYGIAELVSLASYFVLARVMRPLLQVNVGRAINWLLAFSPPMLAPVVDASAVPLLFVPLAVLAAVPSYRREVVRYVRQISIALRAGSRA